MNTKLTTYNRMPSRNSSHADRHILCGTDVRLLAQTAKNCKRALSSQASTYAGWLKKQAKK